MNAFFAGAAQTDITPPLGTIVNGEFVAYYAHHIHDRLYAKALVLNDSIATIAIVMVDICAMDYDFIEDVKAKIFTETTILPENILIAATHTHYAGSIVDLLGSACDLPYRKRLPEMIVAAVAAAQKKMKPAGVAHVAIDIPEHVVCRRYYMKDGYKATNPVTGKYDIIKTNPVGVESFIDRRASSVDPQLSCIAVKADSGEWISVVANYSMHYVGDCTNGTITPDYFGVFSKKIAQELNAGKDFVAMLSNGTSGDANIWDFLQPHRYPAAYYKKSELIGSDLATRLAKEIIRKNVLFDKPATTSQLKKVSLAVNKPSADEVAAAEDIVAQTNYRLIVPDENAFVKIYAREQVLLNEYPDNILFPIQLLRLGDITIGGLGGEFFSESGLTIKQKIATGKHFTITMANGYVGYVPPAHEIEKGGYETWRCRTSFLQAGSEAQVVNTLLEMI